MWVLLITMFGVLQQPIGMPSFDVCRAAAIQLVTDPEIGGAMPPGSLVVQCVLVPKEVAV